ncbi:hypothetical protein M2282_000041 [Variovorax boronicumulans]|nr:hypothetical protein [Variovorax boronicumulans]
MFWPLGESLCNKKRCLYTHANDVRLDNAGPARRYAALGGLGINRDIVNRYRSKRPNSDDPAGQSMRSKDERPARAFIYASRCRPHCIWARSSDHRPRFDSLEQFWQRYQSAPPVWASRCCTRSLAGRSDECCRATRLSAKINPLRPPAFASACAVEGETSASRRARAGRPRWQPRQDVAQTGRRGVPVELGQMDQAHNGGCSFGPRKRLLLVSRGRRLITPEMGYLRTFGLSSVGPPRRVLASPHRAHGLSARATIATNGAAPSASLVAACRECRSW